MRVNEEIRAPSIRVIDENGTMVGIMSVPEGIRLAQDRGLDLIEIAPTANPPTCKIMDYGKFKYENKKKAAQARKNQVIIQTKEVQMRPRTDEHDFNTKMNHARRFLLEGDKVKVNMRFMGREMAHQDLGMEQIQKAIAYVQDLAVVEIPPKMDGRNMFTVLAPDPVKVKEYLKLHPQQKKSESAEGPSSEGD
ncbi:MAG: translation initiation factor IF-3 [Bdellovibrionaceae bacterium]|nr:translation initiation factor IF-3 [Pseudobdellovibrionaceae bacterium]